MQNEAARVDNESRQEDGFNARARVALIVSSLLLSLALPLFLLVFGDAFRFIGVEQRLMFSGSPLVHVRAGLTYAYFAGSTVIFTSLFLVARPEHRIFTLSG